MAGLAIPISVFGLAYSAVFIFGDYAYRQGIMSIGTVYVLFYYLSLLSGPMWQIVNEVQDLQTAGASIRRVQDLLQTRSKIGDGEALSEARLGNQTPTPSLTLPLEGEGTPPSPLEGEGLGVRVRVSNPTQLASTSLASSTPLALHFNAVSFHYNNPDEPVLEDITFQLAPGEVLGLLGRTGSGKTTLTRLLLRLVDPIQGSVSLGQSMHSLHDIRTLPLAVLRSRVSMVTQNVQLFAGSLRDNITFFDDSVPDDRLLEVVQQLGLSGWLKRYPAGLHTPLKAGGQGLSAGESQLLAFTRVFLQDPSLVILDEASSRLDPFTEKLLNQAMSRLLENRTGIIIAHRLQTVQKTDKVMILAQGHMLEFGDRAALAQDEASQFYALLKQNNQTNEGRLA